jgi:hypothetical protein
MKRAVEAVLYRDGVVKSVKNVQRTSFHYQGPREKQREKHGRSLDWTEASVTYRGRGGNGTVLPCYGAQILWIMCERFQAYGIQLGCKEWSKTSLFKRERASGAKISQVVSRETP